MAMGGNGCCVGECEGNCACTCHVPYADPALQDECAQVSQTACWRLMESKGVVPALVSDCLEKVREELDEVIDAWISVVASGQDLDEARAHLEHELGDLAHVLGTACEEMLRNGLVRRTLPDMLRAAYERNKGRVWPRAKGFDPMPKDQKCENILLTSRWHDDEGNIDILSVE